MRSLTSGVVAFAIFVNLAVVLALEAGDPNSSVPASAKEGPSRSGGRSSDKVVVKDVVYGLDEKEARLYLTSQPLDGADREPKRVELKFDIPKEARLAEMALEKLDGKNLMAVAKLEKGGKCEFHCLTFIAPTGGHVRDSFAFHQARFHTTADKLKILALGGKHFNGSVFIVLGNISSKTKTLETVTEGVFYFSSCPWPPSDGFLTPFHAESPPIDLGK